MLPTDQEVAEAKSKPASELPCLDEGPYYTGGQIIWQAAGSYVTWRHIDALTDWSPSTAREATPCRQRG